MTAEVLLHPIAPWSCPAGPALRVAGPVYCGADSRLLRYQGPRGPAAEWFEFGPDDQVIRAAAHSAV